MSGLSIDMIIHPGETLRDVLEDREMSQQELALRAGVSAKHVSTVLNGEKSISVTFAKQLEYALGIEAEFWINLQTNYDKEMLEFEELHSIDDKEKSIITYNLKEVVKYFYNQNILTGSMNLEQNVLDLRKILNVSKLQNIETVVSQGAFRAQTSAKVDPYVLFAWQKLCELTLPKIKTSELSKEEQKKSLLSQILSLIHI